MCPSKEHAALQYRLRIYWNSFVTKTPVYYVNVTKQNVKEIREWP